MAESDRSQSDVSSFFDREIFCLYFHVNPIKQEVFYIGIGNSKRPWKKIGRSQWWKNEVNKYGYEVIIIHKNLSWPESCKLEIDYIAQIGRRDKGLGALVNLTDGGDGNKGCIFTKERIEKVKKKLTGRKATQEQNNNNSKAHLNLKQTKETIAKRVAKNTGQKRTLETRSKMSVRQTGIPKSEETKEKIRQKALGRFPSEETKRKRSETMKKTLKKKRERKINNE